MHGYRRMNLRSQCQCELFFKETNYGIVHYTPKMGGVYCGNFRIFTKIQFYVHMINVLYIKCLTFRLKNHRVYRLLEYGTRRGRQKCIYALT